MRLLDLFCCAGGASEGYRQAGFEVVGVDKVRQPHYPFDFIHADALDVLADLDFVRTFDAVHASPPCQAFSTLQGRWTARNYVDLIAPTRDALAETGLHFIIENVPRAPLRPTVLLCGSMFGLGANGRQLRRHRLFETTFPVPQPPCAHEGGVVGVYGDGGGGQMTRGYKGTKADYHECMGIGWGTKQTIAQAIPPAYTRYIGKHLAESINRRVVMARAASPDATGTAQSRFTVALPAETRDQAEAVRGHLAAEVKKTLGVEPELSIGSVVASCVRTAYDHMQAQKSDDGGTA